MSNTRHQRHLAGRFTAAAPDYNQVATIQRSVARRVVDLIPPHVIPQRILDAGCGTGAGIGFARTRWPEARITGVDIAPGMVRQARVNFPDGTKVDFIEADLMAYHAPSLFDAAISSSALHWIRPFDKSLARLAGMIKPGGILSAGVMLDGSLPELRAAREAVAPGKKPKATLPTFEDLEDAVRLVRGGRIRLIERSVTEVDFDDARSFLRSLHAMGVTGGDLSSHDRLLTRRELNDLSDWYDLHASSKPGVRATFVTGYVLMEV